MTPKKGPASHSSKGGAGKPNEVLQNNPRGVRRRRLVNECLQSLAQRPIKRPENEVLNPQHLVTLEVGPESRHQTEPKNPNSHCGPSLGTVRPSL